MVLGAFHQVMVRFECFWPVLGNCGLFHVFCKYVFTFSGVSGHQRTVGDCNSFWNFTHNLSVFKKSSCFDHFHKSPRLTLCFTVSMHMKHYKEAMNFSGF